MKEYKVKAVESQKKAEELMNNMARDNWKVKAVTDTSTSWVSSITITFEREVKS